MTDTEKVIKELEQFITDFKPFCGNKADWQKIYNAIALLKAQEPRVLSLEEVRDSFVIEYHYSGKIRKVGDELTVDDDCRDYYNRVWRIWNRMPTDEERRAAPWN